MATKLWDKQPNWASVWHKASVKTSSRRGDVLVLSTQTQCVPYTQGHWRCISYSEILHSAGLCIWSCQHYSTVTVQTAARLRIGTTLDPFHWHLTFVQGSIWRVEVHQAADLSLVAELGARLLLSGLGRGVCRRKQRRTRWTQQTGAKPSKINNNLQWKWPVIWYILYISIEF